MIRPGGWWCGAPTPRSPRDTLPSPRSLYELVGAAMGASALSISAMNNFQTMAGVPGFEPGLSVLETDVLTVDTIPLRVFFTWSLCDQYACGNGDRTY